MPPPKPRAETTTAAGIDGDVLPPAEAKPQDLPATSEAAPPAVVPTPKTFGVWIDGAGLEALTALGFLQELEHAGFKPIKVVGTGFGCWVAVSWALENNGNRAEWQAFKWTSWDRLPRGGLLGKITNVGARRSFEEDVQRLLPAKRFENLALPADCPVVPRGHPAKLVSTRAWDLATAMWYQFQIPALQVERPDDDHYSGLAAGSPQAAELEAMSQDIPKDKNFTGWIILRTRTAGDRAGERGWAEILADRSDQGALPAGKLPDGTSWVTFDLSGNPARPTADIQKFEKRREWLLMGRQLGNNLIQSSEAKAFFE